MRQCDLLLPLLFFTTVAVSQPDRSEYFKITVVDAATGRGVPLVELKTENAITVYTDSNGIVASPRLARAASVGHTGSGGGGASFAHGYQARPSACRSACVITASGAFRSVHSSKPITP